MRRLILSGTLLALALASAGSASALGLPNAVYTLDASVAFGPVNGASGSIDPYDPFTEGLLEHTPHAICLEGTCTGADDFSTQDWLIFTVDVTAGTLDEVQAAAFPNTVLGVGYFDNIGGTTAPLAFPSSGFADAGHTAAKYLFSGLSGESRVLFLSFAAGSLPTDGFAPLLIDPNGVQFMVKSGATEQDEPGIASTLVPEPSTALLLGMGVLGLAGLRRRGAR